MPENTDHTLVSPLSLCMPSRLEGPLSESEVFWKPADGDAGRVKSDANINSTTVLERASSCPFLDARGLM